MVKKKRCNECRREKALRAFPKDPAHIDGHKNLCRKCKSARMQAVKRKEIEYKAACRAKGDGFDNVSDYNVLSDDVRLMFELVYSAVRHAAHRGSQSAQSKRWRRQSIEWLLSFDVIDYDLEGEDGMPRWTFGACRKMLEAAGVDLPNSEIIKRKLTQWAEEIGCEIQWEAVELPKEIIRYGLDQEHTEGRARAGSAIARFAQGW